MVRLRELWCVSLILVWSPAAELSATAGQELSLVFASDMGWYTEYDVKCISSSSLNSAIALTNIDEEVTSEWKPPGEPTTKDEYWVNGSGVPWWESPDGNWVTTTNTGFPPLTDLRWERLQTYYGHSCNSYCRVQTSAEEGPTYTFHVSVRAVNNAFLYLCENVDPLAKGANCYWIIFGGWVDKEPKSAIRRCDTMARNRHISCNDLRAKILDRLVAWDRWVHLTVVWDHTAANLTVWVVGRKEPFLRYHDNIMPYNIKHVFVSSAVGKKGHWRFHTYSVLRTSTPGSVLRGPRIPSVSPSVCLSLFYYADSAALMVSLLNQSSITTQLEPTGGQWKYKRLTFSVSDWTHGKPITPEFTMVNSTLGVGPIVAVDGIRQCFENEVRVLEKKTSTVDVKCQEIASDHIVTRGNANKRVETGCATGTFGVNCSLRCDSIFLNAKNCEGIVICAGLNDTQCGCSPGWMGDVCKQRCYGGKYGSGCTKSCGECAEDYYCDVFSGHCPEGLCMNGYVPPFCNETMPVLEDAPELIKVTATTVTFSFKPTKFQGAGRPTRYMVEYKESLVRRVGEWSRTDSKPLPNTADASDTLSGLMPLTGYTVQVVLLDDYDIGFGGDELESFLHVSTACEGPPNVSVVPQERSALISWENSAADSCPLKRMTVVVANNKDGNTTTRVHDLPVTVPRLQPFTDYRLLLLVTDQWNLLYSVNFSTLAAAPSAVNNLVAEANETSARILWQPPSQPNGKVYHCRVSYKHLNYKGCSHPTPALESQAEYNVSQWTNLLEDLLPYSTYEVTVKAFTVAYGPETRIQFSTLPTDLPEVHLEWFSNIIPTSWNVFLSWKFSTCSELRGQVSSYRVELEGLSPWEQGLKMNISWAEKSISLEKLTPFSNYTARVFAQRPTGAVNPERALEGSFITLPTAPPPVRQLADYVRSTSTVSLRWAAPYPPFGRLESFIIDHSSGSVTVDPATSKCSLWDHLEDMYCYTITGLRENIKYNFQVYAKNKGFGRNTYSTIDVVTKESKPGPPLFVRASPFNATCVTFFWKHPNRTHGILRGFDIVYTPTSSYLRQETSPGMKTVYITAENKQYSQMVCDMLPSTLYNTSVSAFTATRGTSRYVLVKTPLHDPHFNYNLTIEPRSLRNTSVELILPPAPEYLTTNSSYFIVVEPADELEESSNDHSKLSNASLRAELFREAKISTPQAAWIAAELQPNSTEQRFVLGANSTITEGVFGSYYYNKPLDAGRTYVIILVVVNQQESTWSLASIALPEPLTILGQREIISRKEADLSMLALLLLLLLPVAVCLLLRKYDWRKLRGDEVELHVAGNRAACSDTSEVHYEDIPPSPALMVTNKMAVLVKEETVPMKEEQPSKKTVVVVPVKEEVEPLPTMQQPLSQRLSRRVRIAELEQYVRDGLSSGELQRQHALFPRGQTRSWDYGRLPQNKAKNRYGNLVAYDDTRVILKKIGTDEHSDYINANYIDGYNASNFYIATQGPKPNTVIDFWRMVWQEQVAVISMLANVVENGKIKCEQYWPDIGCEVTHGQVNILNTDASVFADYTFRVFIVTSKGKKRKVHHLHFTSWPDHGVPMYPQSVATYLKKLLATPLGEGPLLVHCSAGVGRTGTIILADICLRMAATEAVVDILSYQQRIRDQRANMVDNLEQFKLVHLVLLECLTSDVTSYPCDATLGETIRDLKESDRLEQQFTRLKKTWNLQLEKDIGRIMLSRYPMDDAVEKDLQPVYVDGFRVKDQFMACKLPAASSVGHFWHLVVERGITLLIVLQDPAIESFLPDPETSSRPAPHLTVTSRQQTESSGCLLSVLHITDSSIPDVPAHSAKVLQCRGWERDSKLPDTASTLLDVWQEAEYAYSGRGPIMVACSDGYIGCGLFVSLAFLVERIKLEQEMDVCLAVRTVRQSREGFVPCLDQFLYLYDAAIQYLEEFQTYSNFC